MVKILIEIQKNRRSSNEETQNRKIGDNYIPALASNVYNYSNGINGTVQQEQLGKEYAKFYKDPETKEVWEFYRGPVSCSISIMTGYASVRIAGHFTPPSK